MKCVFFPYAGSLPNNPVSLSGIWQEYDIEMTSISYNDYEKLSWDRCLKNISEKISQFVGDDDYFLWGHSMGSTIAYETYYMLLNGHCPLPQHIYFSSGIPPHKIDKSMTDLNNEKVREEFVRLGGIPKQILGSKHMLAMSLRFINRDVMLLNKYTYRLHAEKISCPTTVMFGKEDLYYPYMSSWKELLGRSNQVVFEGDHFFLFHKMGELLKLFMANQKG